MVFVSFRKEYFGLKYSLYHLQCLFHLFILTIFCGDFFRKVSGSATPYSWSLPVPLLERDSTTLRYRDMESMPVMWHRDEKVVIPIRNIEVDRRVWIDWWAVLSASDMSLARDVGVLTDRAILDMSTRVNTSIFSDTAIVLDDSFSCDDSVRLHIGVSSHDGISRDDGILFSPRASLV